MRPLVCLAAGILLLGLSHRGGAGPVPMPLKVVPKARPAGSAPATRPAGLAARYPGDKGIDRHPAVLLHDGFEADRIDRGKWPNVSDKAGALKLVRDPANVHSGRQALQITATLGRNTGGHLFRRFETGVEKMHARFCVKFAEDIDYTHHFVHMAAERPGHPWPTGGAGLKPAGDKKFTVAIEPHGRWRRYPPPGGWQFYCYFWKMKRSGDGKFWGQGFSGKAYAVPRRGRWYCVEFMTKCNTPGKPDGELALWIDGRQLAHHKEINWRSSGKLKLNAFWLMLYVTRNSAKTNRVNTVWFDDVVVATEYVGPPVRKPRTARFCPTRRHGVQVPARRNSVKRPAGRLSAWRWLGLSGPHQPIDSHVTGDQVRFRLR